MDAATGIQYPSYASASPSGPSSSSATTSGQFQSKRHLFSSFSPSYDFYDTACVDIGDVIASDHSQNVSVNSGSELIVALHDLALDKPKSSRFTWLVS